MHTNVLICFFFYCTSAFLFDHLGSRGIPGYQDFQVDFVVGLQPDGVGRAVRYRPPVQGVYRQEQAARPDGVRRARTLCTRTSVGPFQ